MKTQKLIAKIFNLAKKKGLKDMHIRIYANLLCVLYVGEKDRWECDSIIELLQAISEHKEDLSWMNEK